MEIQISDEDFLGWFDLSRPAMAGARQLSISRRTHEAAVAAARAATEGPVRGVIHGRDVGATRALIAKHFPRSIDLELDTLRLWEMPAIPSSEKLGVREDARIGHRARTGRRRGNNALMAALVYGVTGERRFADLATAFGLKSAAAILPMPQVNRPAGYGWHPHADKSSHDHEENHRLQYWMQAWALLHDVLDDEQRLAWMKVIISATRDRLKAHRDEVAHNLTLHGLLPSLEVAAAFPALKESADWLRMWRDIFLKRFCRPPFVTPDGYTREGSSYHNVNTRLLTVAHLVFARAMREDAPELREICRGAYEVQTMLTCADGSHWMIGDGGTRAHHEHWQDGHEALHLGAALFDEPRWKAAAGSTAGTEPELLNLWLMGPEGIERWRRMPAADFAGRRRQSVAADQSGIATLRRGRGLDGHAGVLCFSTEHNHAHHDKGQALIWGLGRHLISDPGFLGYGPSDLDPMHSAKIHATASTIRRTPLGARTDHSDWAELSGRFAGDGIEIVRGQHRYYENHVVRRALALAMPWGEDGPAAWIIWDRIDWKRPWPEGSPEPLELIDTRFPLHAPGCGAKISEDGRSAWSLYDGPAGAPFTAAAPSREDLRIAHELSDSDANVQVTRLEYPPAANAEDASIGDVVIHQSVVTLPGGGAWPRPLAVFRWRGRMPHVAAYVLVPYRGIPDREYAAITGQASAEAVVARISCEGRSAEVQLDGLSAEALTGRAMASR